MALPLYEYANFAEENKRLLDLETLAMDENWSSKDTKIGKPIEKRVGLLWNYIHHTFIRLKEYESHKIKETETKACFNTGLVTENQEEIYAYFTASLRNDPKWDFVDFVKNTDGRLRELRPLPEAAHYFTDPADFIFDTRLDLVWDIDHILDDNFERLPVKLKEMSKNMLNNQLEGAIKGAVKRVKRNYKTAIPQFYRGNIQLLIPICIEDASVAEFALAVRKEGESYVAKTCLTLEMAYNNARLIAKPDKDWLRTHDTD